MRASIEKPLRLWPKSSSRVVVTVVVVVVILLSKPVHRSHGMRELRYLGVVLWVCSEATRRWNVP